MRELMESGRYTRKHYKKNREKILAKQKAKRAANKEYYDELARLNRIKWRRERNITAAKYRKEFPEKQKQASKKYYDKNRDMLIRKCAAMSIIRLSEPSARIKYLTTQCRSRAKKKGRDFEVGFADYFVENPPVRCMCCNDEMDYSRGNGKNKWKNPSIDRIDNTKGYVSGNVAIICRGCNTAKRNFSLATARRVLMYMEQFMRPSKVA